MTDLIRRAELARGVLGHELVIEAFETLEREMVRLFIESSANDEDGRERVYRQIYSMRLFKRFFEGIVEEGVIHQHKLQLLKRGQL